MMKNKEKVTENNSKKYGEMIQDRKIQSCLDCDAKHKWIFQANWSNHNPNSYKSKTHFLKGLIRVEVFWYPQQDIFICKSILIF